jgi:hypothetical protein
MANTSETFFALARSGDIEGIKALLPDPDINPTIRDDLRRSPAYHAPVIMRKEFTELAVPRSL